MFENNLQSVLQTVSTLENANKQLENNVKSLENKLQTAHEKVNTLENYKQNTLKMQVHLKAQVLLIVSCTKYVVKGCDIVKIWSMFNRIN